MVSQLHPPLFARSGLVLLVLGIARISGDKQDERSLEDQEALYRRWLDEHYDGPYELKMISGVGSGERLDRDEWIQAGQEVVSGRYDLVIAEDLGRIARRLHVALFCEQAQDYDTRVITINDHVDTAKENWKLSAVFSSLHHETHNEDTSKRIRRSLRNRFSNGGVVQYVIYGYIKPPGCTDDKLLVKDPAAEAIYDQWFDMLEQGASFTAVSDWLKAQGISPGPYCRSKKWTGKVVARITRNPILKGYRVRNAMFSKRENRTGRRKSVKAPASELLERHCPHLAFIEPARYDRVIAKLDERNAVYARKKVGGVDPRQVPKKQTRFPGQTVYCGVCGRMYVYGGHGRASFLMCNGAREYACWNSATCGEIITRDRVCDQIFSAIEAIPAIDDELVRTIREQERQLDGEQDKALAAAVAESERLDWEIENVMEFARQAKGSQAVAQELRRLEHQRAKAEQLLRRLEERRQAPLALPSVSEIREMARSAFKGLAKDSYEYARKIRMIVPRIVVFPYRLIDSDKVVLRARFRIELSQLVRCPRFQDLLADHLDRIVKVDLFERPQREVHRVEVANLRTMMTEAEAAARCHITVTAAQNAAKLQRLMDDQNLSDPYVPVSEPPAESRKMRRHLHPRYKFDPLTGAGEL